MLAAWRRQQTRGRVMLAHVQKRACQVIPLRGAPSSLECSPSRLSCPNRTEITPIRPTAHNAMTMINGSMRDSLLGPPQPGKARNPDTTETLAYSIAALLCQALGRESNAPGGATTTQKNASVPVRNLIERWLHTLRFQHVQLLEFYPPGPGVPPEPVRGIRTEQRRDRRRAHGQRARRRAPPHQPYAKIGAPAKPTFTCRERSATTAGLQPRRQKGQVAHGHSQQQASPVAEVGEPHRVTSAAGAVPPSGAPRPRRAAA